jgi:hypothetical protein
MKSKKNRFTHHRASLSAVRERIRTLVLEVLGEGHEHPGSATVPVSRSTTPIPSVGVPKKFLIRETVPRFEPARNGPGQVGE